MRSVKKLMTSMLLLLSIGLFAQTITVSGSVTDLSGGAGIYNQTVYLTDSTSGSSVTAVTDSSGYYSVSMSAGSLFNGMIIGYTNDCNSSSVYQVATYSSSTTAVTLNFSICTSSSPGGSSCSVSIQTTGTGSVQF